MEFVAVGMASEAGSWPEVRPLLGLGVVGTPGVKPLPGLSAVGTPSGVGP